MAGQSYRWLHGGRTGMLNMAKVWIECIYGRGEHWGVPQADTQDLVNLTNEAEGALHKASTGERNPVITAECERVFGVLKAKMQYIKERYFLSPPLVDEDYPALLIRLHDRTPTPIARPDAIPDVTWSFPGPGQAESMYRGPINGRVSTDPRSDDKVCYAFGFIGEGNAGTFIKIAEVPATGEGLPNKIINKRKKHHFDFGQYRGMKMCVSYCYVNAKDEFGPWSPVYEFTIP